jgi:anti-sigma factor RsiW
MTCQNFEQAIDEYVDGECRGTDKVRVREHLLTCSSCRARAERLSRLQELMRQEFSRECAPPHLWSRIVDRLGAPQSPIKPIGQRSWVTRAWRLATAAVALIGLVTGGVLLHTWQPTSATVMRETTQDFVTFQLSRRPYDFVSASPAESRDWFAGKIGFELPLLKHHAAGYELTGSRLCWLLEQRLAAFTYQRGDHLMTLYVMDGRGIAGSSGQESSLAATIVQRRADGYGNVVWRRGDLLFSLVSSEPRDEILAFAADVVGADEASLPVRTAWAEFRSRNKGETVPILLARVGAE